MITPSRSEVPVLVGTPHLTNAGNATLVDLLDRVLERGLVINADVIICLGGVPLVGINLRAAVAGMETMTKYGLMQEWDREIRAQVNTEAWGGTRGPGKARAT